MNTENCGLGHGGCQGYSIYSPYSSANLFLAGLKENRK